MEIQDFPNYLIYDDGRVWSKKGKGMFLKHKKTKKGYHLVCLYIDGEPKTHLISRLVAQHYIPNPENKPEVDHIDRDIDNNHVSNLRWATRLENMQNIGMRTDNTSGHKHISYHKGNKKWQFQYYKRGHNVYKSFETKEEALWFKMVFLMKLKYMSR